MKVILFALTTSIFLASLASAGDPKMPIEPKMPVPPMGCDCFGTGFEFSAFGGALLPNGAAGDDALGGGIGLSYFFTENLGAEFAYSVYATDPSEEHLVTGNIVYRFPMRESCIAPYILAGGGVMTNSDTDGFYGVGGGIDIRLESFGCAGLFGDATYNWGQDDDEFTLVRLGVRIPF